MFSKRSKPALGTLASIEINDSDPALATAAFAEIERLERLFSKFVADSDVSRINAAKVGERIRIQTETDLLLRGALEMQRLSERAFAIGCGIEFEGPCVVNKTTTGLLDLSGMAKGFIVDAAVNVILALRPGAAGVVNCGGDLRFFNQNRSDRRVKLRFGYAKEGSTRLLRPTQEAVASSNPEISQLDDQSSTCYDRSTDQKSVTVMASTAAVADGLTKVGLFGKPEVLSHICEVYRAQALIFSADGVLQQCYGEV